ncbi:(R)-mandelonitrile lyase [Streptomyces lydicus]|uniref:(R)-mandelonitrile lyase n=1 Tax=Streptomyces lydicus TaxID=47763 RepID=UPI00379FD3F3
MELLPKTPTTRGPAGLFTGDVWFDQVYAVQGPSRARLNVVRCSPCARTAWHTHTVGQTLHVTEGIGLVQSRGGELIVMRPGDTVHTPPGEWRWHGAAPDHFMTHLALWEGSAPDRGPETQWGEHVTDGEYRAHLPAHGYNLSGCKTPADLGQGLPLGQEIADGDVDLRVAGISCQPRWSAAAARCRVEAWAPSCSLLVYGSPGDRAVRCW